MTTLPVFDLVLANSPALRRGYLELATVLEQGWLPVDVRERIAILIAEQNGCERCISGHTPSDDPWMRAALGFAAVVNARRGEVDDETFAAARAAGVTDVELAEIIGHVVVNVLTNYFASAARLDPAAAVGTFDDDAA